MATPTRSISRVQDLIEAIKNSGLAEMPRAHTRLWFRGHEKAEWILHPQVYRGVLAAKSEDDRLETERFLTQDFRLLSGSIRRGTETDEELYFLQQHYRLPTRLLDWTTNPLAGLFFATERDQEDRTPEQDGKLFMLDASQFRLDAKGKLRTAYSMNFLGIAHARHPVFQNAIKIGSYRIPGW